MPSLISLSPYLARNPVVVALSIVMGTVGKYFEVLIYVPRMYCSTLEGKADHQP